jgi:hypothetical protein
MTEGSTIVAGFLVVTVALLPACARPPASRPREVAPADGSHTRDRATGLSATAVGDFVTFPAWPTPTPPLLPGATFRFYSVECTVDDLPNRQRSRCVARSTPLDPDEQTWVDRLEQCFELRHSPVSTGKAAPTDPEAFRLILTHTTTLVDEIKSTGCENARGRPCDPVPMPTGKRVPLTSTSSALLAPDGIAMGYMQPGVWNNIFPPQVLGLHFYSPIYPARDGGFTIDERFWFLREATDAEVQALAQKLAEIGAATDDPLVHVAVALDQAWLAVRLQDHARIAAAAAELQQLFDARQFADETVFHSEGYQGQLWTEISSALEVLGKFERGELTLRDPCQR